MLDILSFDSEREYTMTPTRELIQVMRGEYFILRTKLEQFESFLVGLAFEDVEVFYHELVFLSPSDS